MTKTAAYSLGTKSFYRDWNVEVPLKSLSADSSAGISFSRKRGLSRMRHIETRYLWLQDAVAEGRIKLAKIDGTKNPANALTKHLKTGEEVRSARKKRICLYDIIILFKDTSLRKYLQSYLKFKYDIHILRWEM